MTGTAYLLTLTVADVKTIARANFRCNWAVALRSLCAGDNILTWKEARDVRAAIEQDMVDGHNAYHGINPTSPLVHKLHNLYQSIV